MKVKKLVATVLMACIFLISPVFEVFAMQVNVVIEYDGNNSIVLEAEVTDTVETLKTLVRDNTGMNIEDQTLVFNGVVLENSKTLQDYNITEDAEITLAGPYSVEYNLNGYGYIAPMTVTYGSVLELPAPTYTGLVFDGWYTDEECTKAFDPKTAIKANTVLYAKWTDAYCTVSFDTTGIGETVIKPIKIKYGTKMIFPEPPVAEGYAFEYWYCLDSEGLSTTLTSNTSIYEDMTAYAHWAIKAENTVKIDNITFRFDNYPVPDQPLTTDGIYIDAGEMTTQLKISVPSWSEWDYYAFDENRLPTSECKPSADSGSVMHFRAGKYYMFNCRILTPKSMDYEFSLQVPPFVVPLDANFTVDCPGVLDLQWWPWQSWTDPETGEKSALVMDVALVFKAPEYKVIEDEITDTTFEAGTDDGVTLHFNGDLALFDELVIDGNVVPKDQYTLTEGSTIVTLKSSYLETLGNGDHTVTAVYNTNMHNADNAKDEVSAVITVQKSEDKPAEPNPTTPGNNTDPASGNGTAPAPVPTATPTNSSGSPNTGDITSITGYLVSTAISLAGIVGINKKRKK